MIPDSDTVGIVLPLPGIRPTARLVKTRYANLRRDRFSGTYFCVAKVCGRLLRQSLETRSVAVAKTKLDELIATTREQRAGQRVADVDEFRFAQLFARFTAEIQTAPRLKPRSIAYRLFTLAKLQESWPELARLRPKNLTRTDVEDWARRFRRRGYSGGLFNSTVDTLRMVCELAVDRNLLARNPVQIRRSASPGGAGIEKERVQRQAKLLPSDAQFKELLARLQVGAKRQAAWWRACVLAYSGQRPENVRQLRLADVDLERAVVHWPPIKHNHEVNTQPMSRKLRRVMQQLVRVHPGDDSPLVPIASARTALMTASREVGLARPVTEGLFRHWFTTRALEAGIPVPLVAAMRGDKDGGAMLLKTYFHGRLESLREQVKKL